MSNDSDYALSKEELEHWDKHGFIGPFTAWSPAEIKQFLPTVLAAYKRPSAVFGFPTSRDRHLDSKAIWTIGTHPAIINRCVEVFGPNLLLWRSNLIHKAPGDVVIEPHQGLDFPGIPRPVPAISPPVNITAWMALTRSTIENGCVQLFPGTDHKVFEIRPSSGDGVFGRKVELVGFDKSNPIYMEVQPGQFFLFRESVVHASDSNHSQTDRIGIAYRFTPTSTKIYDDGPIDCRGMPQKRWHSILVSGENRYRHNRLGEAPQHDNYPSSRLRNLIGTLRQQYYKRIHGMR